MSMGSATPIRRPRRKEKLELIRSMQAEGKSYKQIAEAIGYKSHSAVRDFVKRVIALL